jgi:hypothetical protein
MSLVLASDYRVRDFEAWWSAISRDIEAMAGPSAHHVVVYRSIEDAARIFVTVGVHQQGTLRALLGSPRIFEWFDTAGVQDVPPIFAGEVVEKIELHDSEEPGVVVASILPVNSVERLLSTIHANLDRLRNAGVLHYWVYRALDDAAEVMILREIATEQQAMRRLLPADAGAKLIAEIGGVYPPPFVGRLVRSIEIAGA